MKIKTAMYYIIILHVLQRGSCESVPNTENSLLTLMDLQREHCPSTGMCTISTSVNTSVKTPLSSCCKACSCETDCKDFGNCCPDYHIANLLIDRNITKANGIFNIFEWFEKLNATFQQDLHEDNGSLSHVETTDNQTYNFSCVRSKAVSKDFHMEEDKYPQAYKMIAKCPKDFKGADDMKLKCNADIQIKQSNMNYVGPDMVVPVTSLKTNYTYKNEYCLLCNEGDDVLQDAILWDVIFISFNARHILEDTHEPYGLLSYMTSNTQIYGCNLIYQPRNQVANLVTRCRKVDVKSCPVGTDIDTQTVCTRYHLPVISKHRVESIVYNNIACYMCNNKRSFKTNCEQSYPPGVSYSMTLNFATKNGHVSTIRRYNSSEHQLLNISFTGKRSGEKCEKGFIPIHETALCRLVLCPVNFYPIDGSCIPTFHRMTNVCFTIVLEVIRSRRMQSIEKYAYYRAYTGIVEKILSNISVNFTFSLWKLAENTDALLLTVTKPGSTYIDLLEQISDCLTKIAFLEIETGSSSIEVVTSLFEDDSRPRLLSGKLYGSFVHGIRDDALQNIYSSGAILKRMTDINIDKPHLCYRVKLDPSDIYKMEYGTVVLNKTGMALTSASIRELRDFEGVTTCIDEVNEHIEDSYMFKRYSAFARLKIEEFKKKTASAEDSDDPKPIKDLGVKLPNELVIFLVFAGVVICICLLQFISVKRGQRNNSET